MAKTVEEYIADILDYLKNDRSCQWTPLTMDEISKKFGVQAYLARIVVNTLRLNPNVKYRYINSKSRFKPKEYMFIEDEKEKLDDALGDVQQFEVMADEEQYIKGAVGKEYIKSSLEDYYLIGSLCEKLKLRTLSEEWLELSIPEYARLFNCSTLKIMSCVDVMEKCRLLVKNPFTDSYKLIFSEKQYVEIQNYVTKSVVERPAEVSVSKASIDFPENPVYKQIPEVIEFSENVQQLLSLTERMKKLLLDNARLCDQLKIKDEALERQSLAFFAMKDAYENANKKLADIESVTKQYQEDYRILSEYEKARTEKIEEVLGSLKAGALTEIEEYAKLPLAEKNKVATTTRFKSRLFDVIYEAAKEIQDFKYIERQKTCQL